MNLPSTHSVLLIGVSSAQFVGQAAFGFYEARQRSSRPNTGIERTRGNTSQSRQKHCYINPSDLRQSGIIVSVLVYYVVEALSCLPHDFYTAAVRMHAKPITIFLHANINLCFLLCSYDRARGVLGMVYNDVITAWLHRFVKGASCAFYVPVVVAIIGASSLTQYYIDLFGQLSLVTSFMAVSVASILDVTFLASFIYFLVRTETHLIEATPVTNNSLSPTTTARFRVIAVYGIISSCAFMGAMSLLAYDLAHASLTSLDSILAMLMCYNGAHAGLFGMRAHSFYLKRKEWIEREEKLREVLGSELDVVRGVRSADATFHDPVGGKE